mmetsp:Transcript_90680/g.256756  ORF Transcript_90680/g.256756 Transcript_90680/m.256756 type:complete len:286 (-) Transcript_90680:238-1095(-)
MSAPRATSGAAAGALLAGAACVAPAFISATLRTSSSSSASTSAQLRGTAAAPPAEVPGSPVGDLAPAGLVALALAAGGARARRQRPATQRQFFGDTSTGASKKAESYKDYSDPWLASADLGFDPLKLAVQGGTFDTAATAVPETTYYNYRESEVKHGRFAMGAFLAIFAEAADRGALLKQLGVAGATDNLDATLGLDEVQAPVLLVGLGIQALAEYNLQQSEDDGNFLSVEYKKDRMPGNLGFDPLALGKNGDIVGLHNIEVNAGRLGMIGVTSFLFKEFVAKDL